MLIQRCLSSENPRRVSRGLSTSCRTRFFLAGIFRFAGEPHYASDEGACEISQLVGKCCLGPYICSFRVRFVSHTGVHGRICIPNFIPVSAGSYSSPPPHVFLFCDVPRGASSSMATSVPLSQATTLHASDEQPVLRVRNDVEDGASEAESGVQRKSLKFAPPSKYPGAGTIQDPYLVDWDVLDQENPFNWSKPRKWAITAQVMPF